MNVPTIKLLCWLTSASLTLGLVVFLWFWFEPEQFERRRVPVDPEFVRSVLEEDLEVAPDVKQGLGYEQQVRPSFINLNWTGKQKVLVRQVDSQPEQQTQPKHRPIADVLRIMLIQVDVNDPGGSLVYVTFLADGLEANLGVGDTLPAPNDYAVVHAIRLTGVEFSFKDESRPNETVMPKALGDESLIVRVGEDGVRRPLERKIPRATPTANANPAQTQLIARNNYLLGTEDVEYFGQNYPAILTNEVTTRTYRDEQGRRAGIEIQSVQSGSIAARHGAQAGDILISINGHPVTSEQEAIQFVKNNAEKYSVWEVVIERLGRQETIVYKEE